MKFQASTLDNRNVGSRVSIPKESSIVYGEIASIEQKVSEGVAIVALTDGMAEHRIAHSTWLDVQLSAAENATIQAAGHIQTMPALMQAMVTNQQKILAKLTELNEATEANIKI